LRRYAVAVGDDATGLLLAADYYLRLGLFDEAAELAAKAGKKLADGRVERVLGLVHLHRQEYSLALVHLEKANRDAAVLGGTVRAMLAVGTLSGLAERLEQAKAVKGATEDLQRLCAAARGVVNRRRQLEHLAPPVPGKESGWGRALDHLACAEYARASGQPANRVEQLLATAFVGPDGAGPAFALRGRLALDSGRLTKAAADAARAVALSPQEGAGYFVRGRVRLERNEPGALEDLEKSAELTGRKDAEGLHALAEALFRAGKADRAVAVQREAVHLKPHDREMAEQLAAFEKVLRPAGTGG
jgi:tetratricopeptide (TPR) repeat protein